MSNERFPIQTDARYLKTQTIPWEYAQEAYKEYTALFGAGQSLERIAARGGFGMEEIVRLLVLRCRRLENQLTKH